MTIDEINTVCYVGAGTMGCFNSLVAAVSGYLVVLCDADEAVLARVQQRQEEMAAMLVSGGFCEQADIESARKRISLEPDLARACAGADLVSESVYEQIDVKRDVHRRLDAICPPQTLLTTNSSKLLVSDIEGVLERGERFAALHSHLGAPLVDIVGGPRTSAETIDTLRRFVLSTGGSPLVLNKEYRGYVLNAMLGPVLATSMLLVCGGEASIEEVDSTWMIDRSAAIGPFGLMDMFGINLIHDSWRHRQENDLLQTYRARFLELLDPYIRSGQLGASSGAGFYSYPQPLYQGVDFLDTGSQQRLSRPLLVALLANAVLVASHDVLAPADIDRAWMVGTWLDRGPFAILESLGVEAFTSLLAEQVILGHFDRQQSRLVADYLASYKPMGKQA